MIFKQEGGRIKVEINPSVSVIPKEQLCICGSGKDFSKCCKKKNHTYEAIVLSDSGKEIIYDQTEVINAAKNLNQFIMTRIENINSKLSYEEATRKLRRLYEKLDNALKPIQMVSSCKQGCNYCCYLPILCSELENQLVKDYMSKHFSKDNLLEFKYKIVKNKETLLSLVHINGRFLDENYKLYSSENIPCSFLDGDNNCMIYEVRPFICRKYLVFNEPTVCENTLNKTNQYYSNYHTSVKDAIIKLNKLTYGDEFQYKHILSWFVENNKQ